MNGLINELRLDDWKYDPYGVCMHWWFQVADVLTFHLDTPTPPQWDYHPSPFGSDEINEPILLEQTPETLIKFGNFLERWYRLIPEEKKY